VEINQNEVSCCLSANGIRKIIYIQTERIFFLSHWQKMKLVLSNDSLDVDTFPQKTRHNILWHFTTLVNACYEFLIFGLEDCPIRAESESKMYQQP